MVDTLSSIVAEFCGWAQIIYNGLWCCHLYFPVYSYNKPFINVIWIFLASLASIYQVLQVRHILKKYELCLRKAMNHSKFMPEEM